MKWRNKYGKNLDDARKHKAGDVRKTKKFAFLPVYIMGNTVWLESYYLVETWGAYSGEWLYDKREEIV